MNGYRIANLFGIPLEVNASWLIIFGLILWSLGAGVFPTTHPGWDPVIYWTMALATTLLFFACLVIHELSHALVSRHHGLKIRRIVLFIFGGISEATQELPDPGVEFQVAIAGPAASFALALIFAGLASAFDVLLGWQAAREVAAWLAIVNLALGLFNLLPGFPLDGGRVLRAVAWRATGNLRRATRIASRGGQLVGGLLMAWGLYRLIRGDLVGAIWIGMIGYLLNQAAASQYGEMVLLQALKRVGVDQLMTRAPVVLSPDLSLRQVVDHYLLRYPYGGYPVANGHLEGLLQVSAIRDVPAPAWDEKRVADVMVPLSAADGIRPGTDVATAMQTMIRLGVGRLPVVEGEQIVGMLSQSDVMRYLAWHDDGAKPVDDGS